MSRLHLGLLALFALPIQAATVATAAPQSELQISIIGAEAKKGPVIVTVYKDEGGWLKSDQAVERQKLAPTSGKLATTFKLPPGTYAVQAFQDANDNGKLDMQWLPPGPAEPWVVSNNAQGSMGPPSFKDAKFDLQGNAAISMALQQP